MKETDSLFEALSSFRTGDPDIDLIQFKVGTFTRDEAAKFERKRDAHLKSIERFKLHPMIHQTTLYTHVHRVHRLSGLVKHNLDWAPDVKADPLRIENLALYHDDPEVLTGDIPSPVKRAMTPQEKETLDSEEVQAAELLSDEFVPEEFRNFYLHCFQEMKEKKSTEAQVVNIGDKWDGLGETLHEIRCGNTEFLTVLPNYIKIFEELKQQPIWEHLQKNPSFEFAIPSVEEAQQLPPLSRDLVSQGGEIFWERVFDPAVPDLLFTWYRTTLRTFPEPERILFSGWAEEVANLGDWLQFDPIFKEIRERTL